MLLDLWFHHEEQDTYNTGVSAPAQVLRKNQQTTLVGVGATARVCALTVEASIVVETPLSDAYGLSGSGVLRTTGSSSTGVVGYGARSGAASLGTATSAHVSLYGLGAFSRTARLTSEGYAEVSARTVHAYGGSCDELDCFTVKNPTDEELVAWFMSRRSLDVLTR